MPVTKLKEIWNLFYEVLVSFFSNLPPRRLVPLVGSLTLILIFESFVATPILWYRWLILGILTVIITSVSLTRIKLLVPGWWHTLFTPTLLVTSATGSLLFLSTAFGRQSVIFFVAILLLIFWEHTWRYYWAPQIYHEQSLENASLGLNTIIIWFTSFFFYNVLLDPQILPPWPANNILAISSASIVLVLFLVDYRTIWVQRYNADRVWLLLVSQSLVISEIFWVTNFLPHSIEVKTFLVVLVYYLFTNIGRSHLDGTLSRAVLRRYFYISLLTLLLVLLTAKWVV